MPRLPAFWILHASLRRNIEGTAPISQAASTSRGGLEMPRAPVPTSADRGWFMMRAPFLIPSKMMLDHLVETTPFDDIQVRHDFTGTSI